MAGILFCVAALSALTALRIESFERRLIAGILCVLPYQEHPESGKQDYNNNGERFSHSRIHFSHQLPVMGA
ncbi:MAG: hypothetical protein K8F25_03800 [Fimbriimonadaceae bacterium]|nr:hypothetical protein [Alphaproteobacteria bacterium]